MCPLLPHPPYLNSAGFEGLAGGTVSGDMLSSATVESHPLALDENGLCVCLVTLEQRGSLRMYVAIGTGMNDSQGEDKAVSPKGPGRLWVTMWGSGARCA